MSVFYFRKARANQYLLKCQMVIQKVGILDKRKKTILSQNVQEKDTFVWFYRRTHSDASGKGCLVHFSSAR